MLHMHALAQARPTMLYILLVYNKFMNVQLSGLYYFFFVFLPIFSFL